MASKTSTFDDISKVMNHIQTKLDAPKNLYNSFGRYKYRNLEGILEGLKPLLKETGAYITISDEVFNVRDDNNMWVYIKATATLNWKDSKISVQASAREPEDRKGMDKAQITGATSSYARKYAMNGLFAIDDVKDPDSMDNSSNSSKSKIGG